MKKKYSTPDWATLVKHQNMYKGTERLQEAMDDVSESYKKTSFVQTGPIVEMLSEDKERDYNYNVESDTLNYHNLVTESRYSMQHPYSVEDWNGFNMLVKAETPKL